MSFQKPWEELKKGTREGRQKKELAARKGGLRGGSVLALLWQPDVGSGVLAKARVSLWSLSQKKFEGFAA